MQIPGTIIWKDVRLIFSWWGYKNIVRVSKVVENIIVDEKGNQYHVNLNLLSSIFEPKSEGYSLEKLKN